MHGGVGGAAPQGVPPIPIYGTTRKTSAVPRFRQLSEGTADEEWTTFKRRSCVGFSDAEMLGSPHARTVGVGEAPRHEVAGGGAVQKALRGGAPVGTELAK